MLSRSSLPRVAIGIPAVITIIGLLLFTTYGAAASASDEFHSLPDGDSAFVERLIELQMFEVAAQYCERSSGLKNDLAQQTEWECLLAVCRLRQAWTLASDSRLETIRLAVQRLSDFRAGHTPALRQDIQLRLVQLELLGMAGQIQTQLRRPISATPAEMVSARTPEDEFALKAAEQGYGELESLLRQVDAARKDLDPVYARIARDRIRILMAQMLYTRYRLNPDAESSERLAEARKIAEPIAKNAGDRGTKFRARVMLIEFSIQTSPAESIDLQLKSLEELAETASEKTAIESLRVRSLLARGMPSDALEQSIRSDDLLFASSPELKILRMQCLLHIYELLFALPDADKSSAMKTSTADEFTKLKNRIEPQLNGLWSDRFQQITLRFHRVTQVGPELANAFENVDVLRIQNQPEAAARLLQKIVIQIPPNQQKLRAAVLLELGQLLLKQQNWAVAEVALQESSTLFAASGQKTDAAAADLLRIFSIGRQWEQSTAAVLTTELAAENTSEASIEQRYRSSIDSHLQAFTSESTCRKALEWRAILELDSNSLNAAADLIQSTELTNNISQQPEPDSNRRLRLALASETLLHLRIRSDSLTEDDELRLQTLLATLQQHLLYKEPVKPGSDEAQVILAGMRLALAASEPRGEAVFWESTASEARSILELLSRLDAPQTETSSTTESTAPVSDLSPVRLRNSCRSYCHTILIADTFRRLEDPKLMESSRTAILALPRQERDRCIALLARQLSIPESNMPGNPQLAGFLAQLVAEPNTDRLDDTTAIQINQLSILRQVCNHSNDWKLYVETLNHLSQKNLAQAELDQIIKHLSQAQSKVRINESVLKAELDFWRSVQKRVRPGDDLWLEASLRTAEAMLHTGNKQESQRILNVVNALFPKWGNESRLRRAERLKNEINGVQEPAP